LQDLRPRACLRQQIISYYIAEFFHQSMPCSGLAHHQAFRVQVMFAAPAFDRVSRQRIRRSAEAYQGNAA
jgi:hypothetical protein